jgi:hypothetical protein
MSESYLKYLYKYRRIENFKTPKEDNAIKALLNNYAIFSSRINFNDLFDSKIELIKPTPKQLKKLKEFAKKSDKITINNYIKNGKFSPEGFDFFNTREEALNKLIDSYVFLSLSSNPKSNLMWSHYAADHKGFCIEFKSEHVAADKVIYQDSIPKLNMIDFLPFRFNTTNEELGKHIWTALRTKLKEWEYESEYRFQASNFIEKIPLGEGIMKISYTPDFIESVIFGCRTPYEIKRFIIDNMPDGTKFKQAVAQTSTIEIMNLTA